LRVRPAVLAGLRGLGRGLYRVVLPLAGSPRHPDAVLTELCARKLLGSGSARLELDEYLRTLERQDGISIEVKRMLDDSDPGFQTDLVASGVGAELHYDPEARRATILLPATYEEDPLLALSHLCHELRHLADLHPARGRRLRRSRRRRRMSEHDVRASETRADAETELLMIYAALGARSLKAGRVLGGR
jgi:hypothetical protein